MTKSSADGPKSRARARQKLAGGKYTLARRNGKAAGDASSSVPSSNEADAMPATFRLGDLLVECATFPVVGIEDDCDRLTFGFHSQLLGRAIPTGSVLCLAGALSQEGVGSQLAVESVSDRYIVVTRIHPQSNCERLEMALFEDWTMSLCPVPYCRNRAADYHAIDRCHTHLVDCDTPTLVRMAHWWAQGHRDTHAADPERLGGDRKAAGLVEAAVGQGGSEQVITALLRTLFMDEEDIEEAIWDEDEAEVLRHAIVRERVRLRSLARNRARELRQSAGECPTCGHKLTSLLNAPPYPPQFCSTQCARDQQAVLTG